MPKSEIRLERRVHMTAMDIFVGAMFVFVMAVGIWSWWMENIGSSKK